jgi:hypothetical protein
MECLVKLLDLGAKIQVHDAAGELSLDESSAQLFSGFDSQPSTLGVGGGGGDAFLPLSMKSQICT